MTLQPKRIICAIDFSNLTTQAVHFATKMAQIFQAELFLFHAVFYTKGPVNDGEFTSRAYQWRIEAPKHLDTLRKLMRGTEVTWQPLFSEGGPVEELEKAVHRYHIDLALAVSHEISTLKRMFIGTVIERMVRRLTIPFVIMRNPAGPDSTTKPEARFKRILVACSATPSDQTLMEVAHNFTRRFQAQLHLCHAVAAPMVEKVVDPTQGPYEEVQATLQKRLKKTLVQNFKLMAEPAITPEFIVIPSTPQEALREYARKFQPDLIIVGVKAASMRKKRQLGSTTESIIRRAKATTIIVPLSKSTHLQNES